MFSNNNFQFLSVCTKHPYLIREGSHGSVYKKMSNF